jgi:hypothetical protein
MPTWFSQMFFLIFLGVSLGFTFEDKIEIFLNKVDRKIKRFARKVKRLITAIIKAIILTIKETKNNETR